MGDIKKSVDWIKAVANDDRHGYDQHHRNGPDYDCSSLVATALQNGGFHVSPKSWTGNLKTQLMQEGFTICAAPWKAGDIHLNYAHHVAMSINENEIIEASVNEKGGITGGQTGDQTGKEISIKPYYEYRHGWDCHLRAPVKSTIDAIVLLQVAIMTCEGRYGDNPERRERLKCAGFDPDMVQDVINYAYKRVSN